MSKHIESRKVNISCKPEDVFNFLGNFDNFADILPEQVANWQSTGDSCVFEVKGLATLGLRITGKTPFSRISMKGEGKLPFGFTFDTVILESSPQQTEVQVLINADMNPYIAMMAEKPLQNFIDMLVVKLKEVMDK
jgi:carbon monoxide dehydrogenase subunit G